MDNSKQIRSFSYSNYQAKRGLIARFARWVLKRYRAAKWLRLSHREWLRHTGYTFTVSVTYHNYEDVVITRNSEPMIVQNYWEYFS